MKIRPYASGEDGAVRVDRKAFKAQILADLEGAGFLGNRLAGVAGYEALRLAAAEDVDFFADWLLDHLPLSGRDRLAISLLPTNDRLAALEQAYLAFRDDA